MILEIPTPGSYVASATADYYTAPFVDGAAIAAAFRLEDHEIPLPPPPQVFFNVHFLRDSLDLRNSIKF